jgi:hypothetical protein
MPESSFGKVMPIHETTRCTKDQANPNATEETKKLFCPSSHPSLNDSLIVGVIEGGGDQRSVTYLEHPVKVGHGTLLAFASGNISPTSVFRFAAPCVKDRCKNWSGHNCRVVEHLVQLLPAVSPSLPACKLRTVCRWFAEEGGSACTRCSQVVTYDKELTRKLNEKVGEAFPAMEPAMAASEPDRPVGL